MASQRTRDRLLALIPLIPVAVLLISLLDNPIPIVKGWIEHLLHPFGEVSLSTPPRGSQLLAYLTVAILGYVVTNRLVPKIKQYTLRKGIYGKDMGKRGTSIADKDV